MVDALWFHDALYNVWLLSAIITFPILFFVTAPYGKFHRTNFGRTMHGGLGWFIQEIPSPVVVDLCYCWWATAATTGSLWTPATACLAFWNVHYLHRAVIWPLRRKVGPTTLSVVGAAVGFNLVNGYLNGWDLARGAVPQRWDMVYLGLPVAFLGMLLNIQADEILAGLRKPGESGYKIPYGGAFSLVSSANYFGELLEWTGYAIATGFAPGAVAFVIWTAANLVPRAWTTHKWYLDKFKSDYAKLNRKAIIPYVF
eukprot:ANDGO_07663.mRNA.1 Steroid 5-alpha-reductase DET2